MLRQGGALVGYHAQGHANFAPEGEYDLVCSAVSALTQTALLGLQERLQLPLAVSVEEETGIHCVLGRECTDRQVEQASIVLDTLLLGLQSIESGYGEYLKVTEREV